MVDFQKAFKGAFDNDATPYFAVIFFTSNKNNNYYLSYLCIVYFQLKKMFICLWGKLK
jgi:hypothetical protein